MFKKNSSKVLLVAGLGAISLFLVASERTQVAETLHEKQIRTLAQNSVEMIFSDKRKTIASGSVVRLSDGKLVLLTNSHVCRATNDGHVYFKIYGSEHVFTSPILLDGGMDVDLCAAYVSELLGSFLSGLKLTGQSNIPRFTEILALGHPLGGPKTPSYGFSLERAEVAVADRPNERGQCEPPSTAYFQYCINIEDLMHTNLYIFPGNSGSPVVNMTGELVGVINSGSGDTNYGSMVPLDKVKDFLKKL